MVLTKNGAGTLTLSALNTYTGATTVNGGTLAMGIANAFAASSAVTVNGGATLALNDFAQTANNLSGAGSITLGSATLTANNGVSSTTFAGGISGTGALDKTGAATLTLTGANAYSGGTAIAAGTLTMGNASALGTGILAMAAGTTLDFLGSYTVNNAVTLSGDPTFNVNTGLTTTWTGSISDGTAPGVLDKTGAGTLVLTAASTYSGGTTLDAGTLAITNGQAVGTGVVTDTRRRAARPRPSAAPRNWR
jgi:autotransporter-associated beta strand protein